MPTPPRSGRGEPAGSSRRPPVRDRRRATLGAVAALLLVLGYADLARGGLTAAPVLLVLGYCVGVPAAFLAVREPRA